MTIWEHLWHHGWNTLFSLHIFYTHVWRLSFHSSRMDLKHKGGEWVIPPMTTIHLQNCSPNTLFFTLFFLAFHSLTLHSLNPNATSMLLYIVHRAVLYIFLMQPLSCSLFRSSHTRWVTVLILNSLFEYRLDCHIFDATTDVKDPHGSKRTTIAKHIEVCLGGVYSSYILVF